MPTPQREGATARMDEVPPTYTYMESRAVFADRFIAGDGLEIGGLNWPLEVPPHANVSQVDRMSTEELRREYPEVADKPLPEIDVVDNGETLETIAEESQDFIVANHFLEHTEDPIGTIEIHLGKLKPGGVLFYAVPDKRFTFDFRRQLTPLEHMIRDHEEGPSGSRREHFDEWTRLVGAAEANHGAAVGDADFERWAATEARRLEAEDFSIHMHVWDQASFLRLVLHCRERFDNAFDIEAAAQRSIEFIVGLRKRGAWPRPVVPESPFLRPASAPPATEVAAAEAAVEAPAVRSDDDREAETGTRSLGRRLRGALHGSADRREP